MEKRDLIIVAVGIIVVLIMAVFVKPMITGEQAQFFPSANNTTEKNISEQEEENLSTENLSVNTSGFSETNLSSVTQDLVPTTMQSTPHATPTAVPTWDRSKTTMQLESGQGSYISSRPYPTSVSDERKMLVYSQIEGKSGGTTKPVRIPYGYWELVYDVRFNETEKKEQEIGLDEKYIIDDKIGWSYTKWNPEDKKWEEFILVQDKESRQRYLYDIGDKKIVDIVTVPDQEKESLSNNVENLLKQKGYTNLSQPGEVLSFSVFKPHFSINVLDANSGEVVRTINPPGGLNRELWEGYEDEDLNEKYGKKYVDPRPWKEKFFSGGEYIFDIDSSSIDSYTIQIMVPDPQTSTSAGAGYKKEKSDVLRGVFSSYQNLVNADVYQNTYVANITGALSSVAKKNYPATTTYNTLINDRLSGATLDSFLVTEEWIQGNQGELTGSVVWRIQNNTITIPVTIPFSRDTSGKWFLDSPVYLTEDKLILLLMKEYQDAFNADYRSSSYAATISGLLTQGVREEYSLIQCDYGIEQGKCCSFQDPYCEPADQCCSTREDCSLKGIYRTVVSNRVQGITITDIIPYDTSSGGGDGSLKGEIIWDIKGVEKKTYDDIPVKKDDGWVWRLDTLITLRT